MIETIKRITPWGWFLLYFFLLLFAADMWHAAKDFVGLDDASPLPLQRITPQDIFAVSLSLFVFWLLRDNSVEEPEPETAESV